MPTIALIICTIFVLYMLRLDRKQSPEVSFAFWIPTIWFLLLSSRPLSIWFQAGGQTIEEGSPLDRAFLTVVLCFGLIMLTKRKFSWSNLIKDNICLFFLLGFMLIGCIWADTPFISFKRWTRELIAITMVAVIASEPQPLKAIESLFRRSIYILIPFSYVLINYFSDYGRLYIHHSGDLMWTGVTTHKNQLAQLSAFAIIFIIWTFVRRRQGATVAAPKYQTYLELFILFLALWIMCGPYHSLTYSATAAISLIIGFIMMFYLFWLKKRNVIIGQTSLTVIVLVIIIYGTITPMIGKLPIVDVSSVAGREENLTGRAEVWKELLPVALQHPILGHGHASFWTTSRRDDFDIPTAHNVYLELILTLGFTGLLLYIIFILSNIRAAQRAMQQNFEWGVFWVCSLMMTIAGNITESSFVSFESRMMVVILCLTFATATSKRKNTEY